MKKWEIGPFKKVGRPIFEPDGASYFDCPFEGEDTRWEFSNVYNPACIIKDGKLHFFYRADGKPLGGNDVFGNKKVVCRIGHAVSEDGIGFERYPEPVLYPEKEFEEFEWWGGCSDPHIVEGEDGRYYMNYDTWTGHYKRDGSGFGKSSSKEWEDVLMCASSDDLVHWKKHGPALRDKWKSYYNHSRSGCVICREVGDKLVAAKINGKYYMYATHEGYLLSSDDLIKWDVELDDKGEPRKLFEKENDSGYDAISHEAGACALLTDDGIVYFYNAYGAVPGCEHLRDGGMFWTLSQALIDPNDLTKVVDKLDHPFLIPEYDFEMYGHSARACVVCNSLVKWNGKWRLYYGCSDHVISLAIEE